MKTHKWNKYKGHHDGSKYFRAYCGKEQTFPGDIPKWEEIGWTAKWGRVTCLGCLNSTTFWEQNTPEYPDNRRREAVMATRLKKQA